MPTEISAGNLRLGDRIQEPNDCWAEVLHTTYEPHPDGITVYNVEVEDFHSYFVAAHGSRAPPVWVHNAKYPAPRRGVPLEHTKELTDHLYRRVDASDIVDAHHASHHCMPKVKQAEILNDWDQFIRGTNYNGKRVDVFLKDGYVVITEASDKTRVITSYGREFSVNTKPVDPKRWNFSQWQEGEFYFSPIHRNGQR